MNASLLVMLVSLSGAYLEFRFDSIEDRLPTVKEKNVRPNAITNIEISRSKAV